MEAELAPETETALRANGGLPRWLAWLLASALAAAGASLLAVHLPPAVKLLGLFSIGYGLLVGWIAFEIWLYVSPGRQAGFLAAITIGFMVLAGEVGVALESHRLQRETYQRAVEKDPKRALALALIDSARSSPDAETRRQSELSRSAIESGSPDFADYLRRRVSALGDLGRWPSAAIWGLEIVLGGLAGAAVFLALNRKSSRRLEAGMSPDKLKS